jgi:hypothetical protein
VEGETFDSLPFIFDNATTPSRTVLTVTPEMEVIVYDSGREVTASMNGLE